MSLDPTLPSCITLCEEGQTVDSLKEIVQLTDRMKQHGTDHRAQLLNEEFYVWPD